MKYRALVFLSFFRKNDFVIFQLGFDIAERVQVFHDLRYIGIAVGNEVKTIAHQGVIADLNAHIIPSADFLQDVNQWQIVKIKITVFPLNVILRIDTGYVKSFVIA